MDSKRMVSVLGVGLAFGFAGCASAPPWGAGAQPPSAASPADGGASRAAPAGTAAGQYALGRIDLASGRHEAALQRFRNTLALDPMHVEGLNGIGVAHGEAGRLADSIGAFEQALVLAPDAPHVLGNLGVAQLRGGRLDDAWRSLSRAFELDPSNVRTRENVRLVLEARGAARPPPVAVDATATSALKITPVMRFGHTVPPAPAAVAPGAPGTAQGGGATPIATATTAPAATPAGATTAAPTAGPSITSTAMLAAAPTTAPAATAPTATSTATSTGPAPSRSTTVAPTAVAAPSPTATPPIPAKSQAGSFLVVENPPDVPGLVAVAPNVYELRARGGTPKVDDRRAGGVAPAVQGVGVPKAVAITVTPARVRLEISNGVGEARLAARTALEVARIGYAGARLSDARPFGIATSQIEYRPGRGADARALAEAMGVAVPLVAREDLRSVVDLRLVIGRDLAVWERNARLASPLLVGAPRTRPAMPAAPRPVQGAPRVI